MGRMCWWMFLHVGHFAHRRKSCGSAEMDLQGEDRGARVERVPRQKGRLENVLIVANRITQEGAVM